MKSIGTPIGLASFVTNYEFNTTVGPVIVGVKRIMISKPTGYSYITAYRQGELELGGSRRASVSQLTARIGPTQTNTL